MSFLKLYVHVRKIYSCDVIALVELMHRRFLSHLPQLEVGSSLPTTKTLFFFVHATCLEILERGHSSWLILKLVCIYLPSEVLTN